MSRKVELWACFRSDFILMKNTVANNDNSNSKQIKTLHVPGKNPADSQSVSIECKTSKEIIKSKEMFAKPKLCYEDEISSIENDATKKGSNANVSAAVQKTYTSNTNDKSEWTKRTEAFLTRLENMKSFANQRRSISEYEKPKSSDIHKNKRKDYSRNSDRSESPPCKKSTSNLVSSSTTSQASGLKFKSKYGVKSYNIRDTLENINKERKISENADKRDEKLMATSREIEEVKSQMNELWKALDDISSEKKEEAIHTRKRAGKNEKLKPKDLQTILKDKISFVLKSRKSQFGVSKVRDVSSNALKEKQDPLPGSEASEAKSRVDNPSKNLPKEKSNSVENAMSEGIKTATSLYLKAKNFYDGGNLWCQTCNTLHRDIHEFSQHLHAHYHAETSNPRESTAVPDKSTIHLESAPARGDEFFKPLKAYHCSLCDCLLKDSCVLEKHFTSPDHNAKFKAFIASHTDYEVPYLTQKMTVLLRRELSKDGRSSGNKSVKKIIID